MNDTMIEAMSQFEIPRPIRRSTVMAPTPRPVGIRHATPRRQNMRLGTPSMTARQTGARGGLGRKQLTPQRGTPIKQERRPGRGEERPPRSCQRHESICPLSGGREPPQPQRRRPSQTMEADSELEKDEADARRAERKALMQELNKRHAVIENYGGKCVVACWEPSPTDPSRLTLVFQSFDAFRQRFSNRFVKPLGANQRAKALGAFWLSDPGRRQYRGVTFEPAGPLVVNDCLNTWKGWGVEPKQGDWSGLQQHIKEVIANNDDQAYEYIIRWIAWAIQHPDRQAEVALVLIGEKGTGKGTLIRCLEIIFGTHTFQVSSQEHVVGNFNAHHRDCILFIADEAYWAGDKRCLGALQRMITEPTLSIEQKGYDLMEVPNRLHVIMLAEPGWVVPAGKYERRYAAFNVSDKRRGDHAYFKALHGEIKNGAAAAMMFDLQRMDLGDWHPREVYSTSALAEQARHGLSPIEEWFEQLLQDGVLPHALTGRPETVISTHLYENARKRFPYLRTVSDTKLGRFLRDKGCENYRNGAARGWIFPPLANARRDWEKAYPNWTWSKVSEWGASGCSMTGLTSDGLIFVRRKKWWRPHRCIS